MLNAGMALVRKWLRPGDLSDPDVVLYAVRISVWGRWYIWLIGAVMLARRPDL